MVEDLMIGEIEEYVSLLVGLNNVLVNHFHLIEEYKQEFYSVTFCLLSLRSLIELFSGKISRAPTRRISPFTEMFLL